MSNFQHRRLVWFWLNFVPGTFLLPENSRRDAGTENANPGRMVTLPKPYLNIFPIFVR